MRTIGTALRIFLLLTLLTGLLYPLLVTGVTQLLFPYQANGSMIMDQQCILGSELIGQKFDRTAYFTSRPSAIDYQTLPSGGSNLGATSSKLKEQVDARKNQFLAFNGLSDNALVPSEMLFASASGLDPHISPQAALLQVNRIAAARHLTTAQKKKLLQLVEQHTEKPQFYILGQERVNVLLLNVSLDRVFR